MTSWESEPVEPPDGFSYSNVNDRPPGRLARWGSRVSRGIRTVQAHVPAYAAQWEAHNRAAAVGRGSLWVVLGDSMAQGIGASAYDRGWPSQLVERVDGLADYRMVNLSFYGAGVTDVAERQWPAAARLGPIALVTVVIGSNDLFDKARRAVLPAHLARLLALLPPGTVVASQPGHRGEASAGFNRLLHTVADERGLAVADFTRPIDWRGRLSADHFHPNDRGYAAMADVLAPAVREAVDHGQDPGG